MSENNNIPEGAQRADAATGGTGTAGKAAAPKPKKKRWPITVGVIAAIVVIAGAGMWVWHEQPSFCNAFCHVSMDPYLPTYEAEPGQPALDKWGNEVADASGMMAAAHQADPECNASCMSCHVPTIGEQVAEFGAFVSGDYDVVSVGSSAVAGQPSYSLIERTLDELVAARGLESGDEFCLNETCHNLTREDLVELTAEYERNPHVAQHEEYSCGTCHKGHRASVNYCSKCHADAPIPDGWITVGQEQDLEYRAN